TKSTVGLRRSRRDMLFAILIATLFVLAALKIVFPFFVAPILFRYNGWLAANPQFYLSGIEFFPSHIADQFASMIHDLESEGFTVTAHLCQRDMAPGNSVYLTLLTNYETRDSTALVHMIAEYETAYLETSYIEFNAEYADGFEINTNNSDESNIFKNDPNIKVFRFSDVMDPRRLYWIHRKLSARYGSRSQKIIASRSMELVKISNSTAKDIAGQADFGYYFLDKEHDRYRPTWKGAFLMVWKLAWPIDPIRKLALKYRGKALLESLK